MSYPTNPTTGDTYILSGKTWKYDGANWVKLGLSRTLAAPVAFSDLTSTPTTLAGYGITDGESASSTDYDVVFPSNWGSPTNTYSTSGTWSKGSLADTDLVWIYLLGGGNAGSADNEIGWNTEGGAGGKAMLLYGQAKVFNGGTYTIGAGQSFGGSAGGNTTFTLSSTYNNQVFSSNANPFGGFLNAPFVYVDGLGTETQTQSIEGGAVTAGLVNPVIFTLSSAPSWSGHVGNGTINWNYASQSGDSSIFGGGAGGGHSHGNDSGPSANATTRGSSLYAGNGGASSGSPGAAGVYPGGGGAGGASNGGTAYGGNGANGNMRDYHV